MIVLIGLAAFCNMRAQITQTVSVMPPYSNKLSDYIASPGKINSIIKCSGFDKVEFRIFIRGTIMSTDESIIIRTKNDYKPATPIIIKGTLTPDGAPIFMPYMLTYSNILQIFNQQQLEYLGVTREQVAQQGLPENTYQICFSIYDYETGRPFSSASVCSNVFTVSSVEAPMIISPINRISLSEPETKNVVFTWTRPAGAPVSTQYKLKIIQLNNENTNYQDFIRSAGYPTFFETTVTGNTYLYSAANPQFTPGKTYAFVVSAIDPAGGTAFRNKGFSEVNVFTYQPDEQKAMSGSLPGGVNTGQPKINFNLDKKITPVALSLTTLKGTLVYKYKNGNKKYPLSKAKIKLITKYIVKYADGSINEEMTRKNISTGNYIDGKEIAVTTTGDNGIFSFTFLSNSKGEPLADTDCSVKVADLNQPANTTNEVFLADLSSHTKRGGPMPDDAPAIITSGGENSCKLYLAYAIEIEGEHSRYYLNPDQETRFFFEAKGGEPNDVGEVISLVKTVDVKVKVKSGKSDLAINSSQELANMNVFVFRKINFDYPPIFPAADVTPDKEDNFPAPVASMECVGKGLTDQNGVAKISSLVFNDNPTYQYYLYVNNSQNYNYETDAPICIDFAELVAPKTTSPNGQPNFIDQSTPGYETMRNMRSSFSYFSPSYSSIINGYDYMVELKTRFPSLRIILQETDGLKKLDQSAQVTLKEKYSNGNAVFAPNMFQGVQGELILSKPMAYYDKGTYELNNLGLELHDAKTIVGPERTVTVKTAGFADTTFVVKNGQGLKMGERYQMIITMRYGATFSGRVIDAETREPLPNAALKILGEMSKVTTTNTQGDFSVETRKLNSMRSVEISHGGYITDTVQVKLDKDKNQYYFELYRKARRLRVIVWGKNDYAEGIEVSLPDVPGSWKTDYNKAPGSQLLSEKMSGASPIIATITTGVVAQKMKTLPVTLPSSAPSSKTTKLGASKTNISAASNQSTLQSGITLVNATYKEITGSDGIADFSFAGGQSDRFKVVIANSANSADNYPRIIKEVDIPYSKDYMGTLLQVVLEEGGCLSGVVYVGESNNKPLPGIDVTATISGQTEKYKIETKTDVNGKYTLRNLPVNKAFKLQVSSTKAGNNFVGYQNDQYMLSKSGTECQNQDFHMKTVDGADVTTFLGFPFAATDFKELSGDKISLSGTITLPANKYFGEQIIDVSNVEMKKSGRSNANGDALLIPVTLPFVTDKNEITITMPGNYNALVSDASGLKLDVFDANQIQGEMKARVQINQTNNSSLNGNFGGYGYSLPDLYLTQTPGATNTNIPIFRSSGDIGSSTIGINGLYLSDGENETLTYSIDGFENKAITQPDKSFFDKNGLTLQTKLKAAIANLNPTNVELDAGTINISKQGLKTVNQKPFSVNMGKWMLKCNNWTITNEGVNVADATLSTGVDVKIENLKFTSQALVTDKAVVHLEKVKLLGVKDLIINSQQKGLTYKYLHDGVSGWSLYATPGAGQTTVATLDGLPGLNPGEKIEFLTVDFNSEGESTLALNSHKFRIYNIVDFTPYPSTMMYVTPTSLKLQGTYDFGIPEYIKPSGAMGFFKEGNNIVFDMMDMDAFRFTHQNVHYNLTNDYILSNGLFIAKGTVEEPGNLPELNVTMSHTNTETKIDIDKGQKLPMGTGKELANLVGGNKVVNQAWDVLRFVGDVKGLNNIAPGQKMNFEVKGAVQATGQQINVSDIPSFPGLSITYDLPNARFIGSAPLDMNLGGLKLQGNVNTLMDSQGWLFNASGLVEIPGIGGANLYGLFGNYTNMPPEVSSTIGSAVCLPNGFNTNLKGFFLSAGLTKQILPKIDHNYGIVSVTAGVDVSVNARTYMVFGQGTTFGLGILAEGHAYLGGSCPATCTSANADAVLQLGISGDYNTQSHFYNIDGCSSLNLKISASQCVPVLVGCGPCVSVNLADFTIGASVHLDNTNGFSMGITTQSCDQQCK